ncbi:hypothetical protein [Marinobacter sp. ANT_B65]|uniref:hypothetical protein n=1 Tax=Marinobacter sp. ANT_B65 TaxID=2039467 RepID=UPI0015CAB33D|nr:hypothetical protein [Marinobacter sp. ANT_B65]
MKRKIPFGEVSGDYPFPGRVRQTRVFWCARMMPVIQGQVFAGFTFRFMKI